MKTTYWLLVLALTATLLNACKPLAVDDTVYVDYARHIANHPHDPYGFKLEGSLDANRVLAPPVMLYWLGASMRVFGDHPVLWKIGLLPLVFLFTLALAALCRRFSKGLELPVVALILFAPTVLPCLNLMLDVPAQAVSLSALAVFLAACDRRSVPMALAAGAIAGLAMETKYTAFVTPALFLAAAALRRRPGLGVIAAGLAVALFGDWEMIMAVQYGDSHFLLALKERAAPLIEKLRLLPPLIGLLGATASAGIVLGLAAIGASRQVVVAAALAVLGGLALITLVPARHTELFTSGVSGRPGLTIYTLVFGSLGSALFAITGAVIFKLLRRGIDADVTASEANGDTIFLVLWLAIEVAGYFALSPYPAVRRVLGVVIAGTVLTGRLAATTCQTPERRRLIWGASLCSAVLGLFCFAADFELYHVEYLAARQAVRIAQLQAPGATVWYQGFGAFEFYGGRFGMRRLEPSGPQPQPGDLLAALSRRGASSVPPPEYLAGLNGPEPVVQLTGVLPICSRYQVGGSGLEPYEGSLVEVQFYRWPGVGQSRASRDP